MPVIGLNGLPGREVVPERGLKDRLWARAPRGPFPWGPRGIPEAVGGAGPDAALGGRPIPVWGALSTPGGSALDLLYGGGF